MGASVNLQNARFWVAAKATMLLHRRWFWVEACWWGNLSATSMTPRLEADCITICSLDEAKMKICDGFKNCHEFWMISLMLYRRSNCLDKFIHFLTAGRFKIWWCRGLTGHPPPYSCFFPFPWFSWHNNWLPALELFFLQFSPTSAPPWLKIKFSDSLKIWCRGSHLTTVAHLRSKLLN